MVAREIVVMKRGIHGKMKRSLFGVPVIDKVPCHLYKLLNLGFVTWGMLHVSPDGHMAEYLSEL